MLFLHVDVDHSQRWYLSITLLLQKTLLSCENVFRNYKIHLLMNLQGLDFFGRCQGRRRQGLQDCSCAFRLFLPGEYLGYDFNYKL